MTRKWVLIIVLLQLNKKLCPVQCLRGVDRAAGSECAFSFFMFFFFYFRSIAPMTHRLAKTLSKNMSPSHHVLPSGWWFRSEDKRQERKEGKVRKKNECRRWHLVEGQRRRRTLFHCIAHSRHTSGALWPLAPRTPPLIVCDGSVAAAAEDGEQTKGSRDAAAEG